jgi:SAM-dependent methyltransferase
MNPVEDINITEQLLDETVLRLQDIYGLDNSPNEEHRAWIKFRIEHILNPGKILVDLGGGISLANPVLAKLGMKVFVLDLLSSYWDRQYKVPDTTARVVEVFKDYGVHFIETDLQNSTLLDYFAPNSVDYVTSYHCIEHFTQSPRKLLESALTVLRPGGTLLIEVPNAANLRKRIALLFGHTNYGDYNELYYGAPYTGHIREYTLDDLRTLAKNLGITRYTIFGHNYLGLDKLPDTIQKPVDTVLRKFPGLCSSLSLQTTK